MINCERSSIPAAEQQPVSQIPVPPLSQELVAMIAHELRGPLAVISNILSVSQASVVPAAMPRAEYMLNRQVNRALRLVNDLMELARFSEERLRVDRTPVDLKRVVFDAAEDIEQDVRARRQSLALDFPAEGLWVQGDATRLEQIVTNLLENSCKYSADGGRIALTLSHEDGEAVLRVRDDGSGISPEDLPHVFEPYFRGSSSAQASCGGLGLGLALTLRLVQVHGGTIEARSRGAGRGSEFTVRLPASADAG